MRRSICICQPKSCTVGTRGAWKFTYTPSSTLPEGTKLKFDPLSKGRDNDWQLPQTNLKKTSNLIWMELEEGKPIAGKSIEIPNSFSMQYEFILPQELKAGESVTIVIGGSDPKNGNLCQIFTQRRRPFYLYIDPKGKGDYRDPEIFYLDVRGTKLDHIRVILPSVVTKNQRFDVIVRFEDSHNNLTSDAPEGTLVELSHDGLRENLNWKLFVPETGFITLPNFYFNEPGIYRLKLTNMLTKETYLSSPIECISDAKNALYWGLLHGESDRYDAGENVESCLRLFRDEKAMQFFATSNFESEQETPSPVWKTIMNQIAEFNEEERFATLLGMHWSGSSGSEGLRQLLYTKDNRSILRKKDAKSNTLKKIYKSHTPKELLSILSFTMGQGSHFDFKNVSEDFERVAEIYNAWGSSECTSSEGNPRPITSKSKKGINEAKEGSLREALNQNHRFGFVAGGYDDRGIYDGLFETDQVQYSSGLTAILAPAHTRDALLGALMKRSCYATTGPRILCSLNIAGEGMGSELSTKSKPGLAFNRHISGHVAGCSQLKEITLFRNGKAFKTLKPTSYFEEFAIDDTDPIEKVALKSPDDRPPFVYYYLRAIQDDGHIVWSSPIWVDVETSAKKANGAKKAKKS